MPGRVVSVVNAANSKPRVKCCVASWATSLRWAISPRGVGSDEKRLGRTIVRIKTIESTSPVTSGEQIDESCLPPALVPSEPDSPDCAYEKIETRERVRAALQLLSCREQKVIGLYYYGEATMKEIGAEIGVNESRVSQLHARAIRRLREALGDMGPQQSAHARRALRDFTGKRRKMVKAQLPRPETIPSPTAVVLPYKPAATRTAPARATLKMGRPRQAVAAAR